MLELLAIAHCRAGFEPEAAVDLARLAKGAGVRMNIDAPLRRGFVTAKLADFEPESWTRATRGSPPVFVRSLFLATGPHALSGHVRSSARPDRVAPLVALFQRFVDELPVASMSNRLQQGAHYDTVRLETPDTNDGKKLSGLARALEPRIASHLVELGILRSPANARAEDISPASRGERAADANLHALFVDGAQVYIGASVVPWASPWTMGIPRLRMPAGTPSRSTLKLAEAFVTFLGAKERELVRAGMRAVDLGAAPGGWTWQLSHRGLRVTAVDNGPLRSQVADDPLVTHLRTDGLTFRPRRPVDWMVCDIAEQPARTAALVARWIGEGHARRSIFNLKLPMKRRYDEVQQCAATIRETLAKLRIAHSLELRQLYHDREEVTGYVSRLMR